jgi:hypothetical protein
LDLHLLPRFDHEPVRDIAARDSDSYKAAKLKAKHQFGVGYSPKTVNNHIAVLHRVFEMAIEYSIIEKNPVTKRTWFQRDRTLAGYPARPPRSAGITRPSDSRGEALRAQVWQRWAWSHPRPGLARLEPAVRSPDAAGPR